MPSFSSDHASIRSGFLWNAAAAYLFDIDGTLLNSRDSVHYFAFQHAIRKFLGLETRIDGVPVHGNTDIGIVRAVLRREGLDDPTINLHLPKIVEEMCAEVQRNQEHLQIEICPAIGDLLTCLQQQGKLLGVASGNLEPIGWLKVTKAQLRSMFTFGSFAWPRETRAEILGHGIQLARQRLGTDATVCVVGDTPSDIQAAQSVGVPVMAVATGIYSFDQLLACSPDACLRCASDLLAGSGIASDAPAR